MSFIGTQPGYAYNTITKDTFNGDNSTVAFTLSVPATTNGVEVFVENVQQEPTTAYSVSGSTLTFTSAPPTGTGNIYVVHRNPTVQTLVPPTDVSVNFQTVQSAGNTTVGGNLAVTGTTALTDDLNVDSGTLFVDASTDDVGIGTTSPSTYDDGSTGGRNVVIASSGIGRGILTFASECTNGEGEILGKINFTDSDSTNTLKRGAGIFGIRGADAQSAYITFQVANSGNPTQAIRIDSDGLKFNSDTAAANALDDYEEGTYTPTLTASGTNPTYTLTNNRTTYTKIGRTVYINLDIDLNITAVGNGQRYISLPFAADSDKSYTASFGQRNNSAFTLEDYKIAGYCAGSAFYLTYQNGANGSEANLTESQQRTGTNRICLAIKYLTTA